MKRDESKESKLVTMLVVCFTLLSSMGFAQGIPSSPAQEALDFMNSPQGTGVVNKAQMLIKTSYTKIAFSNELMRVSTNTTFALPIRQFALDALQTYDSSATNTYQEIEAFVQTWPFSTEEPPMTMDTITVMKRGLEIGSSAYVHLQGFLSDTNIPALVRGDFARLTTNLFHHVTH